MSKRETAAWLTITAAVATDHRIFVSPPVGAFWHGRYRSVQTAQEAYSQILIKWDAGNASTEELCNRSLSWLIAEMRMPLASSDRAIDSHIARMSAVIERIKARPGAATKVADGCEDKVKAEVARTLRVYINSIEGARRAD